MIPVFREIQEWSSHRDGTFAGKTIGFVATMGGLHEGHCSLIRRSHAENDLTVASIFLNRTQFNSAADFESYPSNFEQDLALLQDLGVDAVFAPDYEKFPFARQAKFIWDQGPDEPGEPTALGQMDRSELGASERNCSPCRATKATPRPWRPVDPPVTVNAVLTLRSRPSSTQSAAAAASTSAAVHGLRAHSRLNMTTPTDHMSALQP